MDRITLYCFLLVLCSNIDVLVGVPVNINLGEHNEGNLGFTLQLPNNDTIQIDLSVRLLTISNTKNVSKEEKEEEEGITDNQQDGESFTTTISTITTLGPDKDYVTVEEAIEGFRQNLISKEKEIGGIIQSTDIFYRHFRFEFDNDKFLSVRCTYDSNYNDRTLKISCYEYREFQTTRILSNGELEFIRQEDPNYKSDVEFVNLKQLKQTYKMYITK